MTNEHPMKNVLFVFLLIVLSTQFLMFVSTDKMPGITLGSQNITFLDIILLVVGPFCFLKSFSFDNTRSLCVMRIICYCILLELLLPIIFGRRIELGSNVLRAFLVYFAFFILLYFIKSPSDLKKLISLIGGMVIIAVLIHCYEYINDERIVLREFYSQNLINIEDNYSETWKIPISADRTQFTSYIWNRIPIWLFWSFVLSLNNFIYKNNRNKNLFLVAICISGLLIAMVRSWLVTSLFTLLIVLGVSRNIKSALKLMLSVAMVLLFIFILISVFQTAFKLDFLYTVEARIQSIVISMQGGETTDLNYFLRFAKWAIQMDYFTNSPVFGYGMSADFAKYVDPDTGIINTLLFGGVIFTGLIITLMFIAISEAYLLLKYLQDPYWKSLSGGIFAVFIGILPFYLFSMDFFTSTMYGGQNIWLPMFSIAIINKLHQFQKLSLIA